MLTAGAFLIAFVAACGMSLVRHPIYGLSAYAALLYLHPPSSWWGQLLPSLRWSLLTALITLISVVIHRKKIKGPGVMSFAFVPVLLVFVIWIAMQSFWALSPDQHSELLVLMAKYFLLVILIYLSIDSEQALRIFLWTHAAGCFYLGTVVLYEYLGGRFEGFRGPGIDEANAAALVIVTGVITTFVLFLSGKLYGKLASFLMMPITLNGLIATISRSGFLELVVAGVAFNLFTPKKLRGIVRALSIVGLLLFVAITNPLYWERIGTILFAGEQVEGVDTGSGRVVLMKAQLQMAALYPEGCGHRCTVVLSPNYLEERYLAGGGRASHNTFMTLLVEQGIPGILFYVFLLLWVAACVFRLRKPMQETDGLLPALYAGTVGSLAAIFVGDVFVDYLKFEPRFWFLSILMVMTKLLQIQKAERDATADAVSEDAPAVPTVTSHAPRHARRPRTAR